MHPPKLGRWDVRWVFNGVWFRLMFLSNPVGFNGWKNLRIHPFLKGQSIWTELCIIFRFKTLIFWSKLFVVDFTDFLGWSWVRHNSAPCSEIIHEWIDCLFEGFPHCWLNWMILTHNTRNISQVYHSSSNIALTSFNIPLNYIVLVKNNNKQQQTTTTTRRRRKPNNYININT